MIREIDHEQVAANELVIVHYKHESPENSLVIHLKGMLRLFSTNGLRPYLLIDDRPIGLAL